MPKKLSITSIAALIAAGAMTSHVDASLRSRRAFRSTRSRKRNTFMTEEKFDDVGVACIFHHKDEPEVHTLGFRVNEDGIQAEKLECPQILYTGLSNGVVEATHDGSNLNRINFADPLLGVKSDAHKHDERRCQRVEEILAQATASYRLFPATGDSFNDLYDGICMLFGTHADRAQLAE
ncbi:hypothetical protein FOZ60_006441 [Perkinsus olseni]|uniref:Uncharacterized protein n=1 Tax=Perkinsus olseni TaxID=32597 RepID=A0A7J6PHR4_PEROL|nr:hypothetical protein FOZ60_006441 [Perkinsus olseni]